MINAEPVTMRGFLQRAGSLSMLVGVLAIAGCAQVPTDPAGRAAYDDANDPIEPMNRAIFAGNLFVDHHVLKPVATAYVDNVPAGARRSVHNFVSNLGEPVVLVNDLLQGNVSRAWTTTARFAVNTTVGGAGFFDPATGWDLGYHDADFGQTLGVWGVGTGPSVQLPLLGFTNLRDTAGRAVGFVADPLGYIPGGTMSTISLAGSGLGIVDGRAEVLPTTNSLEKTSLDYYATLRSFTAQKRAVLVKEGKLGRSLPKSDPDSPSPAKEPSSDPSSPPVS